ncbi:MAG: hypothetical protein CMN04_10220 [Roseibacillus sp.]|nr:hypothetical protein [Roseibacillus sp.]
MQVFENRWGSKAGDFLAMNLRGTKSNRDAAGARVTVLLEGEEQSPLTRTVRLGEGFQSQSSKRLHFGLGKNAKIASVTVRWPGPTFATETFSGVQKNKFHLLVEGTGKASITDPRRGLFQTPEKAAVKDEERTPKPEGPNSILLQTRQLFPQIRYRDLATGRTRAGGGTGKPTLLLLWHPSCDMCFEELSMLKEQADKLNDLGIEILATTAEPGPDEDPDEAARVIAKTGFPFPAGFTPAGVVESMLVLHRHLFYSPYHLGVPTSFLLDKEGHLAAVYRGKLELSDVVSHLKALSIPKDTLFTEIRRFEGVWLKTPKGPKPSALIKGYLENQLPLEAERAFILQLQDESISGQKNHIMTTIAQSYMLNKDLKNAARLFQEIIKRDDRDAKSRNSLAAIRMKEGNIPEAKRLWSEACQLEPEFSSPRFNLGKQLMKEQRTTEAMTLFLEYHALEPDDPDAHNYLSMGYLRARNFGKAEIHLIRLIELRPTDGAAYTNLAKVYLALRNVNAARDVVTRGLQAEGIDERSRQTLLQMSQRL